jgi:phosphate:Na+ symporter
METLHILMAGLTAIILFVFGLEHFSKEIESISGDRFRKTLGKATELPILGVLIGAIVTGVIQSSSATSVITISLVNAGVLSFKNSVGIIFGSNIGTTITAQLVAFELTAFAPLLIVFGFVLSVVRSRYSVFAKAIFYFGFVFFSLNLISSSLAPLQNLPYLTELLATPQNPMLAILFGCVFTALVQSSSVTTGLAIVFTQQGLLGLENAVPILMGANIGTTATAYISVINMDIAAKKTALSHFFFNFGGVLLFAPLLLIFGHKLSTVEMNPAVALAGIHLIFNVITTIAFLIFINPFVAAIDSLLGEGKMDFERLDIPVHEPDAEFDAVCDDLEQGATDLLVFLQENYNMVTLSIETNYQGIYDAAERRIEYVTYAKKEYQAYFSIAVASISDDSHSLRLIKLFTRFDYLFQIHDSIIDLFEAKRTINDNFIELRSDILLIVREVSSETLVLFDLISNHQDEREQFVQDSYELQRHLNDANKALLKLFSDVDRRDATALTNFTTYSQRLKDKLINLYQLETGRATRADMQVEK